MTGPEATASAPPDVVRDSAARRMAADAQAPDFPGEQLEAIRAAVRRRTSRTPATNLAGRLRALEAVAEIDTRPPVASDHRGGRGVKVVIAKATGWYVGHLAAQVRDLGVATARALRAVAARVDELERRLDDADGRGDAGGRP